MSLAILLRFADPNRRDQLYAVAAASIVLGAVVLIWFFTSK